MKKTTNIAVIGFMGTGKSAVGRVLAERLKKGFVETDALIEKKAGKTVYAIFQEEGETSFREREIEAVKEVSSGKNQVITCGGGVVLNQINVDRLRQGSVIVLLTAVPETILRRTLADEHIRPLLQVPDKMPRIRELLKLRNPLYRRAADITVSTEKLDVDAVVNRIIGRLRKYEGFS